MKKNNKIIFIITIILGFIYLLWRLFFTIPFNGSVISTIFGVLLFYCELITSLGTFDLIYKFLTYKQDIELVPIKDNEYPDIDVLIATHNEEASLLYETINACIFMDYPDKSKVHIYVCDDSNRQEIKELSEHFGIGYIGLEVNKHAKSGNYNNALKNTTSPLIATFDADMIPQRSFLLKTVPYFSLPYYKKENDEWIKLSDEEAEKNLKIGFVQTPQSFYNSDLFQYNLYCEENIPNEQDFFSKEINILKNSSNSTIYTGSNTVISREALESIGLFPINTITEDYETGLRIQAKKYKTFSTTEVLASGITPNTLKGMISQRVRWARGVIQSTRNCKIPFNKKLSFSQNVSYFFAFSYWWSFFRRIIFILAPIMFALFDIQVVNCSFWEILFLWVPSYFFYTLSMRLLSSKIRNQRWNQIIDTILAPFLIIPVFLETIGISQKKFKVTDKSNTLKKDKMHIRYVIPNVILLVLSILAIIRYTKGKYAMALVYSIFIIFWLLYNIINLIYAMYFLLGRKIFRSSDRIIINEKITSIEDDFELNVNGITHDLSKNGISFDTDYYIYFPIDRSVSLEINTDLYKAIFKAKIVLCTKINNTGKYRYRCKITDIDDENKRQYFQIMHDRKNPITSELNLWFTTIDGIILNAHKRIEISKEEKRKSPRIEINKKIKLNNIINATFVNFNYQYVLLKDIKGIIDSKKIYSFILDNKFKIDIQLDDNMPSKNLFKIINYKELIQSTEFVDLINEYDKKELVECL